MLQQKKVKVMNSVSKAFYTFGGILFIIIGLAGFASSVYIYKNPFLTPDKEIIKSTAIKQCAVFIREQGFSAGASSSKGTIEIIHRNLVNWETAIAKMSYAIQSCEGMEMHNFCMGELCYDKKKLPLSGIVANLKYVKPVKK